MAVVAVAMMTVTVVAVAVTPASAATHQLPAAAAERVGEVDGAGVVRAGEAFTGGGSGGERGEAVKLQLRWEMGVRGVVMA